jgi:hypothetical protein
VGNRVVSVMTAVGDLLFDPATGWREVTGVRRAEELLTGSAVARSQDEVSAVHRDPVRERMQQRQREAYARRHSNGQQRSGQQ